MKSYTRTYTHDGSGRLSTVAYPSGLTVKREYNTRGYLWKLKNNAGLSDLVEYFTVNARGQAMEERYGNGTIMTRMFDAQSGRLESVLTEQGMTEIRHDTYKWRSDGLLESRADETGSTVRRESFAHDRLGRLTSATAPLSGGGSRTLSMTYDKIGNLKTRSSSVTGDLDVSVTGLGSGTSAPGPTAATTITVGAATHALSYDTGGRVKRDDDQSTGGVDRYFDWNARGLLKKVVAGDSLTDTTPEAAEEYAYGPDGARYYRKSTWKDDSDPDNVTYPVEHRFYLGGFEERDDGRSDLPKVRVETTRIGGAILHTRTTTTTEDPQDSESEETTQTTSISYLHRDHLGSVRAVTDASGTSVSTASYDPFGGRRADDGTRESSAAELEAAAGNRTLDGARGFTGHEQLDRIGLVHMGGRVYDPRLGRFLSPDPVIGNPGSSQSWNLYSYTGNSPMSFTDPTGLVRSSLPWENNACGPAQGCLNLNSDAGGFGETTQRNDSYRTHIFAGIVTFLIPSWGSGWGLEGGRGHGYNVRTVGYFFAGRTPTSTSAGVPGDREPGQRPVSGRSDIAGSAIWDGTGDRNTRLLEVLGPLAKEGDILGFWTAAKAFGDPFAELALGFHDELRGSNWKTRVAIRRLEESVVSRESSGRSRYTRLSDEKLGRLKVNIGVALIEGHLEALKADIEDNVGEEGVLSVEKINEYHYRAFDKLGLPRNAYGGWWVPGPIQGWLYCSECDPVSY